MRMKRLILPLFCLIFLFCLLVGGGFSYFFFGSREETNDDQIVTVQPGEHVELGRVQVTEQGYRYGLFLDTDSLYLFRHDNPTVEAKFSLSCDLTGVKIPAGYRLALACDITVADTDERGVKIGDFEAEGAGNYAYAESLADYFAPYQALREDGSSTAFELLAGDSTSPGLTYRCLLVEDISPTAEASLSFAPFQLKFLYRDYSTTSNGYTYQGNMAPSSQYQTPAEYETVMAKAKAAGAHANVSVVFRLILQNGG